MLKKDYKNAVMNAKKHESQLAGFEATILEKNLPLSSWRKEEEAWCKSIISQEASDDPRSLRSVTNPYEPIEEQGTF